MIGKVLSKAEFQAGFEVKGRKTESESAYSGLKKTLNDLSIGEVCVVSASDMSLTIGRTIPKHFKAAMRKRLVDWFGKGTYSLLEATAEGKGDISYAFVRNA